MKLYHFALTLVLAGIAGGACAFQRPIGMNPVDDAAGNDLINLEAKGHAVRALRSIEGALGKSVQLACDRCKSGFALKVVERAMQKPPPLHGDQYAEVERLRAEGESLYNEKKYPESLELLRKAEGILGIDPSGDTLALPSNGTPRTGTESVPGR